MDMCGSGFVCTDLGVSGGLGRTDLVGCLVGFGRSGSGLCILGVYVSSWVELDGYLCIWFDIC